MRPNSALALLFCSFSSAALAQAPAQAPAPAAPGEQPLQIQLAPQAAEVAPSLSEKSLAPAYTIKSGTQLVVLDITVKDKKGNKIHGLKASDFIVKESGRPQAIRNFDEHGTASTAPTPAGTASTPAVPKLPPGEFTNLQVVPPTGALNIILVDQVNTSLKDQAFMRGELVNYLKHARPDTRTAIFALNNKLVMLQGFSSDPAVLLAALTGKGLKDSTLRDDTSGGVSRSDSNSGLGQIVASAAADFPTGIAGFEAPAQAYQQQQRAYITLDALNDLSRFLVALPGRKNLIWFAGDFPPNFFPSENSYDGPYAATAQFDDEYRDTVNLLSRAEVVVYPVDAQGLRSDQANNASVSNANYATGGRGVHRSGNADNVQHQAEFSNLANEHQAMDQIAHDTGGEAFYNHNDLSRMVVDAVNDGASYYSLAYVPSTPAAKDQFRGISVQLEAAGGPYTLSYRRGYYTDKKQRISAGTEPAVSPATPMEQALRAGSPPPAEILLRTKAFPVSTPDQTTVASGNQVNPGQKAAHPPFRDYKVEGAVSILKFGLGKDAGNNYHVKADFVTNVYDAQGNLINSQSNTIDKPYSKEKLAEVGRNGMHFSQQVSVPVKGDYFIRVAVHDNISGSVGAVEFPVAAVSSLPMVNEDASTPTLSSPHP